MSPFSLVKASLACTQLLGSDPVRFFEFGQAPQLEALPYATHQLITGTPYNALSGRASADHITVQIDVWAETSAECRTLANEIRNALELDCYVTSWLGTGKESGIFRCTFMVQIIELRQ